MWMSIIRFLDSRSSGFIYNELSGLTNIYPNIYEWFERKVIPGLGTGERVIIILYDDEGESGLSILKIPEKKICYFRIVESKRRKGYGTMLMNESIRILQTLLPMISVSYNSLNTMSPFLIEKFGFKITDFSIIPESKVVEFFFNSIPQETNILMSIKTEYSREIFYGNKKVELRKRFSNRDDIGKILVYSSGVEKMLSGYFTISGVEKLSPLEIWDRYKDVSCIEEKRFKEYYGDTSSGVVIKIGEIYKFPSPISPKLLFGKNFIPPQNYGYIPY